jgi:hypothetical protein
VQPIAQLLQRLLDASWPGAFLYPGLEVTGLEDELADGGCDRGWARQRRGRSKGGSGLGLAPPAPSSLPLTASVSIRTAGSRLARRCWGSWSSVSRRPKPWIPPVVDLAATSCSASVRCWCAVVELAWRRQWSSPGAFVSCGTRLASGTEGAPPHAAWAPGSTRALDQCCSTLARRCPGKDAEVRAGALDPAGRRSAGSTRRIPPRRRSACCRLVPAGGEGPVAWRSCTMGSRKGVTGAMGSRMGATRWSCDGGARVSWDGESPWYPRDAARRPLCCKLQHLLPSRYSVPLICSLQMHMLIQHLLETV